RFKHVITDDGHAVITGRDGETLQRCEDEPIHIPGAVQGFGLLIALHEGTEGKLTVRVASENSKALIGYTPKQLFELDSFCDILSEEQADNLLDHLDFIRDEEADPATNGPEVFTLSIRSPQRNMQKLWCAMHINDRNANLIICEFELEDDQLHPLVPPDETTPEPPEDTLQNNPTAEELAESTVTSSKPLRVLRKARKRRGEAAAMEVFNIMSQVQEQLDNAPNLDKFLKVLVGVVKELTGFHRVMVYQFDQAWNGRVVTELVDPRATKDLYKGLNFPASDIPKQARELYKINKVRLLYDRDLETARLVCRTTEDLETPLDLTYAYLRAMSPIHIKYLTNMAVRASMSISITAFNELWGLIACHSYGSKGMRVSFPIRKMCRLVGDSASRNIERLSYASRLQARKLINTASTIQNPSGYIIASSDDLLKLFDADCGLLSVKDETKILGKLEQTQEALAMLEYLRLRRITSVTTSQDIKFDFPDLRYPPGFSFIAGLLLVPLSTGGNDFIVFFRKGQVREVKWAGNPYEKFMREGTEGYLEPRKSFKTWNETVVGKCREWTEDQIETAAVLCLVYGKFIEVWRHKEAALQNTQLTRLLLANSAHEVRTPLNAIINYLEIALEGSLDQETRDNLAKSHSASKSLIYVINDLLDLTKTEEGHELIKDEVFDLPATVKEAADTFQGDAKRKQIYYEFVENPDVPQLVVGDQRRLRQAISNVTANAIQHTEHGGVKVELWLAKWLDGRAEVDIVIQDTGVGMSATKLDALFRDLEQVQTESDVDSEEVLAPDNRLISQGKEGKRTLGLGLAVVARIIRNMNGQLRLKSEEGKGSRFVIQLGFDLPVNDLSQGLLPGATAAGIMPPRDHPTTPPAAEGEVMLVHKSAQKNSQLGSRELNRKNSADSLTSIKSSKSWSSSKSAKGDVDRLIDALSEPHMVSKAPSGDQRLTRPASSNSRAGSSSTTVRPSGIPRAHSFNASTLSMTPKSLRSPTQIMPGQAMVIDSKTPVKPVRMPDEASSPTTQFPSQVAPKVLFDIPDDRVKRIEPPSADHLQVLVAEDDPINSKIIKKRLEKSAHDVYLTVNGEECASAYGEKPASFDVVLMDMQMPIVDGLTSTKMIRSFEKTHSSTVLSQRAAFNGRVPVFAVSASLVERDRQTYIDAGFDGWVLKPVDFKRLNVLLAGILEKETREDALYQPGQWERGGWFTKRQPNVFAAMTAPSGKSPVADPPIGSERLLEDDDPFDDPISKEQARLASLEIDA
ncbi:MAG: Light-sensor Protein kinase, partial [Pleopsidium flavum]